ncbi:hypothetical protein L2E82_20115 [Cichorium intybus]|uniref:Uncharacterized protein n=1 Tax=Cichorium intybus TaxID=13427 RepID=A0ACB9DTF7_CICIN|nr:hypothetical protein L2E82_20115 [Cichorium intybus]
MSANETETNLTEEERKKLEKLQAIPVKFLRLVQQLGLSPDESVAAQFLYRPTLIAGRQTGQSFSLDAAKRKAMELEVEGNDDLDFSVNILVIGKAGVGKTATINSIFGEEKTGISAFQPATDSVKEIRGMVGGVAVRVFDTPGLRSSGMDQGFNKSVLSSAKKLTKKNPADIRNIDVMDDTIRKVIQLHGKTTTSLYTLSSNTLYFSLHHSCLVDMILFLVRALLLLGIMPNFQIFMKEFTKWNFIK